MGAAPLTLGEACDEIEQLLEGRGADFMMRLVGMMPKEVATFTVFCARLIDAIQMTNDERVHTKENHTRTCVLNTEYVGTVDFKLEAADYEFLWRKGYLYTYYWLENKNEKAKDKAKAKRKKVGAAVAKEMLKAASAVKEEAAAPPTPDVAKAEPKPEPKAEPKAEPAKAPEGAASVPKDGGEILRMRLQGVLSNTVRPTLPRASSSSRPRHASTLHPTSPTPYPPPSSCLPPSALRACPCHHPRCPSIHVALPPSATLWTGHDRCRQAARPTEDCTEPRLDHNALQSLLCPHHPCARRPAP